MPASHSSPPGMPGERVGERLPHAVVAHDVPGAERAGDALAGDVLAVVEHGARGHEHADGHVDVDVGHADVAVDGAGGAHLLDEALALRPERGHEQRRLDRPRRRPVGVVDHLAAFAVDLDDLAAEEAAQLLEVALGRRPARARAC